VTSLVVFWETHLLSEESISSTASHASRASGDEDPNFRDASTAALIALVASGRGGAVEKSLEVNDDGAPATGRGRAAAVKPSTMKKEVVKASRVTAKMIMVVASNSVFAVIRRTPEADDPIKQALECILERRSL